MNHPYVNPNRPELIEQFFIEHLPHKLAALESYPRHSQELSNSNAEPVAKAQISAALSYGCIVAGRLLLEFLGVTYSTKTKELSYRVAEDKPKKEFDVYVDHLGGTFVRKEDLSDVDMGVLKGFLHAANRSAHLTWDDRKRDGHEDINAATTIILRLMHSSLYLPTKRQKVEVQPQI